RLAVSPRAKTLGELERQRPKRHVVGAAVGAEMLQRRSVDQPHSILAVDDDDALPQVLDDVVVELDEVAEVDAPLLGERLGLDDTPTYENHDRADQEQHDAEQRYGHVLIGGGLSGKVRIASLREQRERRDRREEEREPRRHEQPERADGNDQEPAEAVRESAARVDERDDDGEIGREQERRLTLDGRPPAVEAPHLDAADREHHDQRAPRELRPDVPDEPRLVDREDADQERGRDREAEEIQKPKDAPAEIRI